MSTPKLRILMIEDNPHDAELALRNLKRFEVTIVNTLKGGITELEARKFDCVLLDLHMANSRKDTVIYEVNMKRGNAATVVLTGDINPRTREHMLYVGADAFLVKGTDDKTTADMEWCIFRAIEHRKGKK